MWVVNRGIEGWEIKKGHLPLITVPKIAAFPSIQRALLDFPAFNPVFILYRTEKKRALLFPVLLLEGDKLSNVNVYSTEVNEGNEGIEMQCEYIFTEGNEGNEGM